MSFITFAFSCKSYLLNIVPLIGSYPQYKIHSYETVGNNIATRYNYR